MKKKYKKILIIGSQKSGKTVYAIKLAKKLSKKPIYIATYDNSYNDKQMQKRIKKHKKERISFKTIEKTKKIYKVIKKNKTYLIDDIGMMILNYKNSFKKLKKDLKKVLKKEANIIFILNDINSSLTPIDKFSRKFIDINGLIGQYLAKKCNKVYKIEFGLERKIK